MSFQATFQRLGQKLDRHERVVDLEQRRGDYRRVQEELLAQEESFRRLRQQVNLFREGELPLGDVEPLLQDLGEETRLLGEEWAADPVSLLRQSDRWERLKELTDMIETILDSVYEQVQTGWQSDALPAFYAPLTRQTPLKALVERIQSIDADLPRLLPDSIPNESSRLKRARALKTERDRVRKQLEESLPVEVRDLFARIARGEASLSEITPTLLEQIRELQADRVVRLTLR